MEYGIDFVFGIPGSAALGDLSQTDLISSFREDDVTCRSRRSRLGPGRRPVFVRVSAVVQMVHDLTFRPFSDQRT